MADNTESLRLVLASASPRRRELLAAEGYRFEAVPPPVHEPPTGHYHLTPSQQAEAVAYFKARTVSESRPESWVLGADTIVSVGGQVLGKPGDRASAEAMLRALSGSRHEVITGVALLGPSGRRLIASDATWVTMRAMAPDELDAYLASEEWVDKAGAYAIQETADRFVTEVEGSFTNVVGLPMELLRRMIGELREHPDAHQGR